MFKHLRTLVVTGIAATALLGLSTDVKADTYTIDGAHSAAVFSIDHLGVSRTWGRFTKIEGSLTIPAADAYDRGVVEVKIWTAPKSDPIPVEKTRLGAADVDYDGRTDLVLYSRKSDKTRIRVLRTRYDKMLQGPSWQESFSWGNVRPY